jgi:hypothetical protein
MEFVQMTDFSFYKKVEYRSDIRPLKSYYLPVKVGFLFSKNALTPSI